MNFLRERQRNKENFQQAEKSCDTISDEVYFLYGSSIKSRRVEFPLEKWIIEEYKKIESHVDKI